MTSVAVHPPEPSAGLIRALGSAGIPTTGASEADLEKEDLLAAWDILLVELGEEPLRRVRLARRLAEDSGIPILLVVEPEHLELLDDSSVFSDLVVGPPLPRELALRIDRLVTPSDAADVLIFEDLELNTATYEARLGASSLDLTYMEYELLRFFVEHRGRVWSREQLLKGVWGYDYFGGARTVDVHIRRLRSKLGESRSGWITTVRSVGYRFG